MVVLRPYNVGVHNKSSVLPLPDTVHQEFFLPSIAISRCINKKIY